MLERISLSMENVSQTVISELTSILSGEEEFRKQLQDNSRKLDEIL